MPKRILKIIVLGNASVGKTSLMTQYVNRKFSIQYKATIGADFMSTEAVIDDDRITLHIWDTAGQERFQSLGASFYRGADACVLVYDITSARSLTSLDVWRDEFLVHTGGKEETFPFIVIGNKCDKEEERTVEKERAELWCKSKRGKPIEHFECSAKTGQNVHEAFLHVTKLALEQDTSDAQEVFIPEHIDVDHDTKPDQGGCGC
ncbi:Small GTPase like protein [Aduncisulcus paluster]|uniref:Small GTPase like protein n=1 Tax=Aduncisulcus paluster TaxID=2918883 RepID=A0ABQ5KW18_9EUKA|nr:Small GTPase like protein [Aduncisulcus paluster]